MILKDFFIKALSESFPWVKPIYETCLSNREQWKKLSDLVDMGLTWIDHPFIDKPVEHIVGESQLFRFKITDFKKCKYHSGREQREGENTSDCYGFERIKQISNICNIIKF